MPLKLNAQDSSRHFPIQDIVFASRDFTMIAVILKKTTPISD